MQTIYQFDEIFGDTKTNRLIVHDKNFVLVECQSINRINHTDCTRQFSSFVSFVFLIQPKCMHRFRRVQGCVRVYFCRFCCYRRWTRLAFTHWLGNLLESYLVRRTFISLTSYPRTGSEWMGLLMWRMFTLIARAWHASLRPTNHGDEAMISN